MSDRELVAALPEFDAGLLNDYGGGNVGWWQDYIRALLGDAHAFYQEQFAALSAAGRLCNTENSVADAP